MAIRRRGRSGALRSIAQATIIRNSYIGDIKAVGIESQAIAGWNGPGPYTIENNVLEAAGVNLLFGGADPAIPDLVPSDITIERNLIIKNVDWRGSSWTVKNLLELKNARRVRIEGNQLENCWSAAQPGYAVLFTVRNSGGRAPWATIEDVTFRNNVVRHSAGGINILGYDSDEPSQTATGIAIENNLFEDINHRQWGGNGLFLQIGNGATNVTVDHNTVLQTGNIITAYGRLKGAFIPIPGFTLHEQPDAAQCVRHLRQRCRLRQGCDHRLLSRQRHRVECDGRRVFVSLSGRQLFPVGDSADG